MRDHTRRDFLKSFGGAAAAWPFAGRSMAQHGEVAEAAGQRRVSGSVLMPPDQWKPLGYAVVGIGSIAMGEVMPALTKTKRSRLTGFVSGHPDKARHFAQLYGVPENNIYNYDNYDQIASNPDIDAVYIALPNSMHAEYTIRGAKAGKHVLCEKPMCTSVKDGEAMIAACRAANRRLMIAYRLHYEQYNLEAMKMCHEKQFGPIKMVDAEFSFVIGNPKQWRLDESLAGGGSMMDIGIYCLQAARYLTGEEPLSVYAQTWSSDPGKFSEVEENISFLLSFPSGVIANCYSSYGIDGMDRYRAAGPQGWIEMEPAFVYSGLVQRIYKDGKFTTTWPSTWDQFAAEIDAFSAAVQLNRDIATPGEEGLRDMKIIAACYQSARTRQSVALT
ncbi:MAG: Gfo/Idh/MocA family oxidoreductase [Acidobacteriia bacterium]|nr:Gfo/Idh/MocA family oxidoreductase [Terriglobia bacterium]